MNIRDQVPAGGLMSLDGYLYRCAPAYVARILRGEKPPGTCAGTNRARADLKTAITRSRRDLAHSDRLSLPPTRRSSCSTRACV